MNTISQSEYSRELERLEQEGFVVQLTLGPADVVSLIGNIQLALRHPANTGETSNIARGIKDTLIQGIEERYPLMGQFLRCGDNPEFDA